MALELFSTITLLGVISRQSVPDPYWLNLAFQRQMTFETEEIMFDLIGDDRRLAPFVAPNVQGRVMKDRGSTTKTFRPAYVKPKHEVNPSRAIPRMVGESLGGGDLSLEQKYNAIIADNMRLEKESIIRRWDWMACRAVVDGAVTVSGEDYPTVTVDFGRDPSLTKTLVGTARWGQADADPLADIEAMRTLAQKKGRATVTRLTFGLDAWGAFAKDPKVKDLLDTRYRGSSTDFNRGIGQGLPYEYRGNLEGKAGVGSIELYTYADEYEDADGNLVPYLNAKSVVGTGPGLKGVRCFGAIKDKRAGLKALPMFPKMWDQEDPSQTFTMTQSAPLMVPGEPNGSFLINALS